MKRVITASVVALCLAMFLETATSCATAATAPHHLVATHKYTVVYNGHRYTWIQYGNATIRYQQVLDVSGNVHVDNAKLDFPSLHKYGIYEIDVTTVSKSYNSSVTSWKQFMGPSHGWK